MDLLQLRNRIDEIDAQIVDLYEQRMQVSSQVADYKIATGGKVYDSAREQEKLKKVSALAKSDLEKEGIRELYEQIMAISRKLQYVKMAESEHGSRLPFIAIDDLKCDDMRVVFQGAEGAYSQMAMFDFFGKDVSNFHVDTFRDVMGVIEEGSADYAVLPIENSTAGVVSEIYDLLAEYENYIVGEQLLKIEHCLIACPGAKIENINTVYSHPQSLMQSARFLTGYPKWQQIGMKNNAFAVKKVAEDMSLTEAAIASEYAAEYYGMNILEKGINQSETNCTRFIIVTGKKIFLKKAGRISICFEIEHEAGSLYHALSHIIFNNLNMTKIESRPIQDRNWEYRFFVDFEGNLNDSGVKNALRGLREETRQLRILGNY